MNKEGITALATEAFEKGERLRLLGMQNMHTEYEARKQAAIAYALAEADAADARARLYLAIGDSK